MMRRVAWRLLRWLAGLAAVLVLIAGFLVWRLSAGPISLDPLTPFVARSIARAESGLAVRVDHTLLSLGPRGTFEVVARGVHLTSGNGGAELTLPELAMGFSPIAALRGIAAPTEIVLDGPELRLVRAADGTFHLGLGAASAGSGGWADALLRDLAAAPDRQGPLGFLTSVTIQRATLTVNDRALGVAWRAQRADAAFVRGARGVSGDLTLTATAPNGVAATLHGGFGYIRGAQHLDMRLSFSGLRPADFAAAAPVLAPLAALDLPVSGAIRVALATTTLRISDAACDVSFGPGSFVHPALVGGRVAIASGTLRARYDPGKGSVAIERLDLDLGGPRVAVTGTVGGIGADMLAGGWPQAIDVEGALHLGDVPADALPGLWPEQLSPHSRDWVTGHIHDGVVIAADARFSAHADLKPGVPKPVRVDSFAGTFAYRGLTVEYFKPLAPLRGVDGTASFDRAHLDLVPTSGTVKGVRLTGGDAKLTQLDTDDEQIAIDFGVKGPLRDVLDVLNTKPLEYARALKIDTGQVAGEADGRLYFAFPLKHDLTLDMVDFRARAKLSDVVIGQVVAGRNLSAGNLQLALDPATLRVDGTARLDDVPVDLQWTQSLKKTGPPARYRVVARLDEAARQKLGLALPAGIVTGPVGVDATYTIQSPHRAAAKVALDFRDAALAVKQLNWKKATGVPAQATLDLDLADDHIRAIRQVAIKGGGLDARLGVALDGAGRILRVDVPRLIAGETDVAGSVTRRAAGGWNIAVKGLSFDASGLLEDLGRASNRQETGPPLLIDATLDRLVLGPKREARAVKGEFVSDGVHWQSMSIDAGMFGNGKASLRFGQAAGGRNFRLATDDFGALLRLFDISDNVDHGRLEVTGKIEDQGARRVLRGKADGADYRMVNAPLLARLLSVASLSGIGALLSGEGIPFTTLKSDFVVAEGKLEVKELRAYGGALGIKADGVYDFARDTLDFSGTLVPAYTLNSVLGNIPLLGPLITGGKGEGIFAANFRVAGPASDAKVTVNPLSALAPGVLRKLFLFDAPEPSAAAPPPAKSGGQAPQ
jgi:hypothetical protein